jgi:S1-C subfamily serine protease
MRILLALIMMFAVGCQPKDPLSIKELSEQNIWKMRTPEAECTAFQVDQELLVTAAHCANSEVFLFKNGDDIVQGSLIGISPTTDIALFYAPGADRPGFVISQALPESGDNMIAAGFPARVSNNFIFARVKIISVTNDEAGGKYAISLGPDVWPGMSGGPLLNDKGEVMGVVSSTSQVIFGPSDDPTSLLRETGNYAVDLYNTIMEIVTAANKKTSEPEPVPDVQPAESE